MGEKSEKKNDIGARLAHMREKMHLSQEEVAQELNIPRSGVSLIESGDRGIKIEEIKKYSDLFHTKVEKLVNKNTVNTVSEIRTTAGVQQFYPLIADIVNELGIPADGFALSFENVLANVTVSKKNPGALCKANITFHMATDATVRQGLIDMVDEISALYPAAKPALAIDADDKIGTHVLSFLTMGNELPVRTSRSTV